MTGRLQDKVAIVTGGAQGIGEACARRFAAEGAYVFIADLRHDKAAAVADSIGGAAIRLDVTSEDDWADAMARVCAIHGRLDVLVNNAGIVLQQSIEDSRLEDWNRMIAVNLTGTMLGCKYAVHAMKENPGGPSGSIINMASIASFIGLPDSPAYNATKGGVRLLTKSVAVHAAQNYRAIRCNSLHPGTVDTPIHEMRLTQSADPNGARARMADLQPMGRVGLAAEIADAALFLAGDESRFMTGAELLVDGGWMAEGGIRALR